MYGCRGNAEHTGTVNSITGARNACKQEALDPTNTEMWHLEGVSSPTFTFLSLAESVK